MKVARTVGGDAVISSGIQPGETVVTDGQLRLIPGIKVQVENTPRRELKSRTMNIAEPFIRRPIMTTLVMAAILLFGILGYRELAVSDLPNVDYPDDPGDRGPARRESRHDGRCRGHAAGKAVLHDRRHRFDDVDQHAGQHVDHLAVRSEPQHRRRGAGRAGGDLARVGAAPAEHADAADVPESEPADQPIYYIAMGSQTLPLYTVDQYAETLLGAADFDGEGRGAGAGVRRAEVRGARCNSIPRRWLRGRSASTR